MNAELYEAVLVPSARHTWRVVVGLLLPLVNLLVIGWLVLVLVVGSPTWFDWVLSVGAITVLALYSARAWRLWVRRARALARRTPIVTLRLDRQGVHVTNGATPQLWRSFLPWNEVVAVVCSALPGTKTGHYLQFVARDERLLEVNPDDVALRFKSRLLSVSPAAASLVWLAPRGARPPVGDALAATRLVAPTHVRFVGSSVNDTS